MLTASNPRSRKSRAAVRMMVALVWAVAIFDLRIGSRIEVKALAQPFVEHAARKITPQGVQGPGALSDGITRLRRFRRGRAEDGSRDILRRVAVRDTRCQPLAEPCPRRRIIGE